MTFRSLITLVSLPMLGLTACAAEPENDSTRSSDPAEAENVGSTSEALTAPPSGVGITLVGNTTYHMKNGTGDCAYWTEIGRRASTATCSSTASNQLFAAYKMYDGDYNLCIPDTLTSAAGTVSDSAGTYSSTLWSAICLRTQKDANLVPVSFAFQSTLMSFKDRSGVYVAANNAQFKWSAPYLETKGFNSRRVTKWYRKAAGPLYPEIASSISEQKWSFY